jgi:hypothetical protein
MNDDDFRITVATALGRIEQKIDGYSVQLAAHIADDKALGAEVSKLQLGAARQRGVIAALTTVGTVLGAGVGYAIDAFALRGHH